MSISYNLRMNNSKLTEKQFRKILNHMGYEIVEFKEMEYGFEYVKINPEIKVIITYYKKEYPQVHPASAYDTIFLENEFCYNETISYDFYKCNDSEIIKNQYKLMLCSAFETAKEMNNDALFTGSGGEDIFFYRNQIFYIEQVFYEFVSIKHHYILENYNCKIFEESKILKRRSL